ncbi:coenzyme F420-0:L-glutamate ligase [Candidatus Bathyarchaeota archaeon]|nr:coenzyme F420-0:L-glutamate ligase [Candidatus Bathyarchaeota archaeon]MBS7629033.1 coenzyme F420-0:L-glutamate ligase [Candidatus Bathyarchaeota archaeon]
MKLPRYRARALRSSYWKPGTDYKHKILDAVRGIVQRGDVIVVSEKAISTAMGRIIDESGIQPSLSAELICKFWMRKVWAYFLGPLTRLSRTNISRLKNYPLEDGARHKQLSLSYAGLLASLKHGSEGGIDVSNLPYSYASIPLSEPYKIAYEIKSHIKGRTGVDVDVMIVDSDKTFSIFSFHMSSRPSFVKGIKNLSLFAFIFGRLLRLRPRSTPIALASNGICAEEALQIAAVSNRVRGDGAGKTAWDVAEHFKVGVSQVSWEMLESVSHYPLVIVRRIR